MQPWQEDLRRCVACPRACGADRTRDGRGYCRTGDGFEIGAICAHRGEEPVLGGARGTANVFFAHCNLQCAFCQNHQISRNSSADPAVTLSLGAVLDRIAAILATGVRHVGFVSPSHCVPQMRAIITGLHARGLRPVTVMNTGAYDTVATLRDLADLVDVYLPDLKYLDDDLAARCSDARDYPDVARSALHEMHRQKGSYLFCDDDGHATAGLIVRHLVLPGHVEYSKRCLEFIARELSPAVHVSLLAQYRPTPAVSHDPDLGRRLHADEYAEVVAHLHALGLRRGWMQEPGSADHYNPDFRASHPFA